ncbi:MULTISPECIES: DUF2087 domain-containing protein [Clostridium]|jgi:DNA-binding CsgD family transcriptional regulator|uniref:DUF2087 domain-containing protein n=2 Tax=Clostridium TaxID=1485 RepID=UPI001FAE30D2|nr:MULTISPECIES: DUF2087 domain-containing protein [Clostridium]MDB1944922.1 DUF2087 domain-containing protein [Clostridium tertium]MDB1969181.1 DUF2087 domain-containing protein [Clostridium tertium]MDU1278542.1 DUF2087 domain-containing protein [Clostridium sp.]MDU2461613.1 DUF2087 domain-containing protein [Clostridium sp.]MDU3406237.1 DUF2087 domain-containing protein [Clostridium sp.]
MLTHGSSVERLLMLDKNYTGLTEIQKELLDMLSSKCSDKEIARNLACTESTVRNIRFSLRERARQARAFLDIMELVDEGASNSVNHKIRYFPIKEEKRKALLPRFANLFEPNRIYTEGAVKTIINKVYDYDSLIKRYLVDYGYLKRDKNGEKYCKVEVESTMKNMKRKELINNYKQQEVEMGIIQIYNTVNGYSFVDICLNLYKPFESIKFKLNFGNMKVKGLQEDWDKYGEDAFEFKVVEKLKKKEGSTQKEALDDLKELLNIWIDSQGDNLKLYNR